MTYETGTLLWGANKSIGNIWIVTNSVTRCISMVFDGKTKMYQGSDMLVDFIKPTSFLYELTTQDYAKLISVYGFLPAWAVVYFNTPKSPRLNTPAMGILPPISTVLPQGVVEKVEKALGVNLTEKPGPATVKLDDSKCIVGNGEHRFVPYTGLNHSFEFCIKCDAKRKG